MFKANFCCLFHIACSSSLIKKKKEMQKNVICKSPESLI